MSTIAIKEVSELVVKAKDELTACQNRMDILKQRISAYELTLNSLSEDTKGQQSLFKSKLIDNKVQHPAIKATGGNAPNGNTYTIKEAFIRFNRLVRFSDIQSDLKDFPVNALQNGLTYLRQKGEIIPIRTSANRRDTRWALKEWVNTDGTIKEGYEGT